MSNQGILIMPQFGSPQFCAELIYILSSAADLYIGQAAANRVEIPAWELPAAGRVLVREFRQQATELLTRYFDSGVEMEYCVLTSNYAGDSHAEHCDNCLDDGSPNHTPWRSHTCNLYLDDHYSGGEFAFPELAIEMVPAPGTLLAFPSTRGFKHNVFPITGGVRHSVLSWFTHDTSRTMRELW
jgi:predicted 2-oxoglutarate/Fe(II)-dependent dioxygenase YbiX